MRFIYAIAFVLASAVSSFSQVFPPGTFSVGGFPIVCGSNVFILTPQLGDSGLNDGQGHIYLNPVILGQLPLVLQLYIVGHECGHSVVGPDETAADCWSIRTGRNQGWFPPQAFQLLYQMLQNNPGDIVHPTGPQRFAAMLQCYNAP
jgi:hypothetical protein